MQPVQQDLFAHLQALPPSEFDRRQTGDLLMRLTGDIQMLRQMLVDAIINAGQSALVIVAMIAAMFWLNPTLAALGDIFSLRTKSRDIQVYISGPQLSVEATEVFSADEFEKLLRGAGVVFKKVRDAGTELGV